MALCVVLSMSACICTGPETRPMAEESAVVLTELTDELPQGAVYQEAYERAKSEITMENAADRLREIDQAIRREQEELRR